MNKEAMQQLFKDALEWGRSYGMRMNNTPEMLDEVANQFADKALSQQGEKVVRYWECGDSSPEFQKACTVEYCGMREDTAQPTQQGEPVTQQNALPPCKVVERGFRWDGFEQHHVPKLVIEFEPVPYGKPNDSKGWKDRDALAAMLASSPPVPQAKRTALEQYDLEQSPDYRRGWDDGRMKGYEVGVRHGKEQHLFSQASVKQEPVAQIVHAADEQGTVEWLVHSGRPIRVGQMLYTHPAPVREPLNSRLLSALAGLLEQVENFAATYGEGSFETAEALAAVDAGAGAEAASVREPLTPEQRRRIILQADNTGHAISLTERAHNIGTPSRATHDEGV